MAFYDKFPYTNFQELNLDKIMQEVGRVREAAEDAEISAENAAASATESAGSATASANSAAVSDAAKNTAIEQAESIRASQEQINANTARIDSLIAHAGDTEGNSELLDIRIGFDGNTYPIAGDAVRAQGDILNTAIESEEADRIENFNQVFDTNIIYEKQKIMFNSGTGGAWKLITLRLTPETANETWHIHCGTVINTAADRKISALAYDSADNSIGGGEVIMGAATDVTYALPTNTAYVIITFILSRSAAISPNVNVTFNDVLITKGSAAKIITLKDSAIDPLDSTSKSVQYKTQYLAWSRGIYDINQQAVIGDAYYHASIPVQPGEEYRIDGYSYLAINPCIFVDAQDHYISKYPLNETASKTRQIFDITVPANAVKMYCNAILNYQDGDVGQWDMYACIVKRKLITSEYQISKKLIVLSDSWSEKNITASSNYVDYLLNDGFDVYNDSVGGTGYRRAYDENKAWYQRALNLPSDRGNNVLIFGSFNDMGVANYDLGTIDSTDLNTICGCINATLDNIYTRLPLANIMVVAPGPWRHFNNAESDRVKANNYINAIRQICEKRQIPFLDFFTESGMRPWMAAYANAYYKEGFANNTTHPNDAGQYYYVYPKIRNFLIRNCI